MAVVDLSEDMAIQVMVELLPTPSSSPSGILGRDGHHSVILCIPLSVTSSAGE